MSILRNDITFYSQIKDAFLWGTKTNPKGQTIAWSQAALQQNVTELHGFTTFLAGFSHNYNRFLLDTEFNRYRAYMSFYTSGFRDLGWPESAKLRLYITESYGVIETDTSQTADNFDLILGTVSGLDNRNKEYTSDGNIHFPLYGFGDVPTWSGCWGFLPTSTPTDALNAIAFRQDYQSLVATSVGGTKYQLSGKYYRFRNGWLELPINLSWINTVGESHFKLGSYEEITGVVPSIGVGGEQTHAGWLQIQSSEAANKPQLVITYVATDLRLKELRNSDLTLQRYFQELLNNNATFSGLTVLDGYPEETYIFDKKRCIGIEHLSTLSENIEMGSKKSQSGRRFMLDIVCDRRGELEDLTDLVFKNAVGNMDLLDFSYGFIQPKPIGSIYFEFSQILNLPSFVLSDRNFYRNMMLFDVLTMTSGV